MCAQVALQLFRRARDSANEWLSSTETLPIERRKAANQKPSGTRDLGRWSFGVLGVGDRLWMKETVDWSGGAWENQKTS